VKRKKSAPAKRGRKATAPAKVSPLKSEALEVPPEKLAWTCGLEHLKFETTEDLQVTSGTKTCRLRRESSASRARSTR